MGRRKIALRSHQSMKQIDMNAPSAVGSSPSRHHNPSIEYTQKMNHRNEFHPRLDMGYATWLTHQKALLG